MSDHSTLGSICRFHRLRPRACPWDRAGRWRSCRCRPQEALFFVGIDWAAAEHAVPVLDQTGRQVAAFTIEPHHGQRRQTGFPAGQTRRGSAEPVAIERPAEG